MKTKQDDQLWQAQNFFKNAEFVSSLLDKADIGPQDTVVEIGPGKGIITRQLAKKALRVVAVECDLKLAENLKTSMADQTNVEIVKADFLDWNLPSYPYKVFANIPFNLTADIVNKLLLSSSPPQDTYLIMQDKAAARFIGAPVGQNSQVSVLLQPFYDMGIVAPIDRRQFEPVPSVNAVLTRFKKREKPLTDPRRLRQYRDLVIFGYNQWQPTVLDAFRKVFSGKQLSLISRKYSLAGLKPSELTSEQWLAIFDSFLKYVPADKQALVWGAEKRLKTKQRKMQKWHRTRNR